MIIKPVDLIKNVDVSFKSLTQNSTLSRDQAVRLGNILKENKQESKKIKLNLKKNRV